MTEKERRKLRERIDAEKRRRIEAARSAAQRERRRTSAQAPQRSEPERPAAARYQPAMRQKWHRAYLARKRVELERVRVERSGDPMRTRRVAHG